MQATFAISLWILVDLAGARGSRVRRLALGSLVLTCALWSVGELLVRAADGPEQVVAGRRVVHGAIIALPVLWLWVSCLVANPGWYRRHPAWVWLPSLPLLACYSFLFWDRSGLHVHWTARPPIHGPVFYVQIGITWALFTLGTAQLVGAALRLRGRAPLRVTAILLGSTIPLLGNGLHLIAGVPATDPTPVLTGFGALLIRFAIVDSGLAAVLPLGQRRVLDQLDTGVLVANLDGVIVDANRAARELVGNGGLRGRPLEPLVEELPRRSGRVIDVQRARLRSRVGDAGWAVLLTDRTDAVRMEQQLLEQQRVESLGILAGGIAHDFNNLLTGVITNAGTALKQLTPGEPAQERIGEAIRAARIASHLTEQLLAYAGKGQFQVRAIDLGAEVREMEPLLRSSGAKRHPLQLELASDLPPVEGDPAQVKQVILNLVLNAAEASAGDAPIRIGTGVAELDATDVAACTPRDSIGPGRYVWLEVSDRGSGMDARTRARIFDPFFTSRENGRGLGLAATLGIVSAHRGAVRVESEPGRGSAFRVFFPVAEKPLEPVHAPDPAGTGTLPAGGSALVLVVDDEEYVREAAHYALEHFGYRSLMAGDGIEAVELMRAHADQIAVVLLDANMPGLSGEETLPRLRAIRPDVPVIVSSGYEESEASKRFSAASLSGFLRKPYDPDQLAAKVEQILAQRPPAGSASDA